MSDSWLESPITENNLTPFGKIFPRKTRSDQFCRRGSVSPVQPGQEWPPEIRCARVFLQCLRTAVNPCFHVGNPACALRPASA